MPSKPSRPNQFGITLSEDASAKLLGAAELLKTRPATLAAFLVEQGLTNLGAKATRTKEAKLLEEIRRSLEKLSVSHHNAAVKILSSAGGLTKDKVRAWADEFLK